MARSRITGLIAASLLVLLVGWNTRLFVRYPRLDEYQFVEGFRLLSRGGSPYQSYGFNYPPPYAVAGSWIWKLGGQRAVLAAMRTFNCAGCVALLVGTAELVGIPWLAMIPLSVLAVPVLAGLEIGNLSPGIAGFVLVALLLSERRPRLAGVILGLTLAIKPLGAVAVTVLLVRRSSFLAGLYAVLTAAAGLSLGRPDLLPGWFGALDQWAPRWASDEFNVSLMPAGCPPLLWLAGVSLLATVFRGARLSGMAAGTMTACMLSSPVVWDYTLTFLYPPTLWACFKIGLRIARSPLFRSSRAGPPSGQPPASFQIDGSK